MTAPRPTFKASTKGAWGRSKGGTLAARHNHAARRDCKALCLFMVLTVVMPGGGCAGLGVWATMNEGG